MLSFYCYGVSIALARSDPLASDVTVSYRKWSSARILEMRPPMVSRNPNKLTRRPRPSGSGTVRGSTVRFGNLNATYPGTFVAFSPERLFTALGSNVVDVNFFVPGTTTPATVSGFGSIFTDVDLSSVTTIQYFDAAGASLGVFTVPPATGDVSFLGVSFNAGERVSRVRITSGNVALGPNDSVATDVVVMNDFIYSEPVTAAAAAEAGIPTLSTWMTFAFIALIGMIGFLRIR